LTRTPDKLGDGDLVRFDIFGLVNCRDQFGHLNLRLALGAAERVKLCFPLARLFVPAGIEFKPERILAALLDVTLHDLYPVNFRFPFFVGPELISARLVPARRL
jgi:hypothetical protein